MSATIPRCRWVIGYAGMFTNCDAPATHRCRESGATFCDRHAKDYSDFYGDDSLIKSSPGGEAVSDRPKPTCPFCGAAPKENWTEKVRWFTCGTMVGPDNTRHDQTIHCMTDEVSRLTRERDEARNFARKLRSKAHTSEPYPWLKTGAKEAKP